MKKILLCAVGCVRILVRNDYVSQSYRREFVRIGRSVLKNSNPLFSGFD